MNAYVVGVLSLIVILCGTWYLAAPLQGGEQQSASATVAATATNPWGTKPSDAVLLGVFSGTLPCADCSGIDTKLELTKYSESIAEGTYTLNETYHGKSEQQVISNGVWTTLRGTDRDEDATVYQLDPDNADTTRYFQKMPTGIRLLDRMGNVIVSDHQYDLHNVTDKVD